MGADAILSRVERARKSGPGRWMCKCPAHEDRTASLSIRETDDGVVLLKCFAGCEAREVVASVGLDMQDLFPPRLPDGVHSRPAVRRPFYATDVLRHLALESKIIILIARMIKEGKPVSQTDYDRALLAASRIEQGLDASGVGHV